MSANQIAEYMRDSTASQRETILRSAKFPRTTTVVAYTMTRHILTDFLPSASAGMSSLDGQIDGLATKLRREPDGWMQDELRRNIEALEAFKLAYKKCRLGRVTFSPGPADLTMNLGGVRLNTRLDARILESTDDGSGFGGGVVMYLAAGEQSRKNVDDRCKTVAALVHWSLQSNGGNIEPLAKLCMCFDVFGQAITKAPKATDRLRANIEASCREAAGTWASVAPPNGYDGPDWK